MENKEPAQPEADADGTIPIPETGPTQEAEAKWIRCGVVMVAAVTVVLILGLLIVYFKLDDMQESNDAAASAEMNLAKQDQRAWMEPAGIDAPLAVESPLSITIKAVNRGRTLANTCVLHIYLRHLKVPETPDFSIIDSGTIVKFPAPLTIAPGQQVTFPSVDTPQALTRDLFDSIQSGQVRVFILGNIRYDDIFKKRHWFKFCYVFDPKSSQWIDFGNSANDNE